MAGLGSYDELLSDSSVECVYVGNVHAFRRPVVEKCLNANKNVLVEKPFACSAVDAEYLIGLAKEKNLFIMEVGNKNVQLIISSCGSILTLFIDYHSF